MHRTQQVPRSQQVQRHYVKFTSQPDTHSTGCTTQLNTHLLPGQGYLCHLVQGSQEKNTRRIQASF
jgi:hypothetical protein